MSFKFTVNHKEAGGFGVLPEGEYEVVISNVKMKKSGGGEDMLNLELTIRKDFEQEGQGRKIFDNLLCRDTMMWKFQQVFKAIGEPDGIEYNSLEDIASALKFRTACVKVIIGEYQGDEKNEVKYYKESMKPDVESDMSMATDPFANTGQIIHTQPIDISDEDVPF
jgi:hypothetical protein